MEIVIGMLVIASAILPLLFWCAWENDRIRTRIDNARSHHRKGSRSRIRAHGEVVMVTQLSRRTLAIDCLVADGDDLRRPVYVRGSGPLISWNGASLADVASSWADLGERLHINLYYLASAGVTKAELAGSKSSVTLDIENTAEIHRMLSLSTFDADGRRRNQ